MQPDDEWIEYDEEVTRHIARHRLTPEIVFEVVDSDAVWFKNRPGQRGSHLLIGPDRNGRFWTIILDEPSLPEGRWQLVTGWRSSTAEVQRWQESR